MHKYRLLSKKGEGTFSEVLKAQSIKTGKHVAIKCMKNTFDNIDQVNNLREIQALRRLQGHPNVIKLAEVLYDEPTGRLALVFELMEMNMYEAIRGRRHYLPEAKVQLYVYELLKALDHMHRHGIFHRDVKPENLLLNDEHIKLADLGSCRGIYSRQPYTEYISTRWYRAPECLLTDGYYSFKMDIFAAGCVWFEILALFPLFPGTNELDQIQKIHNVLGTPAPEMLARKFKRNASHMDLNFPEKRGTGIERLIPHATAEICELMKKTLEYDPDDRIIARQALKDSYFKELRDADRKEAKSQPSKDPEELRESEAPSTTRRAAEAQGFGPQSNAGAATGHAMMSCSSSSSVGSAPNNGYGNGNGNGKEDADRAPELSGKEGNPEDTGPPSLLPQSDILGPSGCLSFVPAASSTSLPALGKKADDRSEAQAIDLLEEDGGGGGGGGGEDGTLLPPIGGKLGMAARASKQKEKKEEKVKPFKAAANATLRGTSGSFSVAPNEGVGGGMGGSKGFERPAQGAAAMAMGNSGYGKKFGQGGAGGAAGFSQSYSQGPSERSGAAPQSLPNDGLRRGGERERDRAEPNAPPGGLPGTSTLSSLPGGAGQLPRTTKYVADKKVSPYSHKQKQR